MAFKDNPLIFLGRKTWEFSEGNRKKVVLFLVLFFCANGVSFFIPLVLAKLLNTIQEKGVTQESLPLLIGITSLYVVLQLLFWCFHGPARVLEMRNAFLVRANYKKYLVNGVLSLPPRWHMDHHSGDTIDRVEKASRSLYEYAMSSFQAIETVLRLVSSYLALVYFNIHAAYLVFFLLVVTAAILGRFDRVLRKRWKELLKAENIVAAKMVDVFRNIMTIIILRVENIAASDIMKKVMQPFDLFRNTVLVSETKWFVLGMSGALLYVTVIVSYLVSVVASGKPMLIGTIAALAEYIHRINDVFFKFTLKYNDVIRQKVAVESVEEIAREFKDGARVSQVKLGNDWKTLEIKELSFSYHGEEGGDLHLDKVSLLFRKGERVAIVGKSGSGKTTFLKLMHGLFEPKHVEIVVDGRKIGEGLKALKESMILIPQDAELFATTVRENITLGNEYPEREMRKAADRACITEVIEQLPQKWDSSVIEKGVNLSGGEKQRLALARGLLAAADQEILLLDEPTSSIDVKTEMKVVSNILTAFKEKTIFMTMHRLYMLKKFDRVIVFDKGRIVADGKVEDVLKSSRELRTLWKRYQQGIEKEK